MFLDTLALGPVRKYCTGVTPFFISISTKSHMFYSRLMIFLRISAMIEASKSIGVNRNGGLAYHFTSE